MQFQTLLPFLCNAVPVMGSAILDDLKWEFFDESSCFVHAALKINGTGPTRGLITTQNFAAGDELMKMTDECLICPDDILEETPGNEFNNLQSKRCTALSLHSIVNAQRNCKA